MRTVRQDLKPNEKCGKPCPEHGDECPVVGMEKGDVKLLRKVFGSQLNKGRHLHLCLSDPSKPHSWKDNGGEG